jgi:hypothetical protein
MNLPAFLKNKFTKKKEEDNWKWSKGSYGEYPEYQQVKDLEDTSVLIDENEKAYTKGQNPIHEDNLYTSIRIFHLQSLPLIFVIFAVLSFAVLYLLECWNLKQFDTVNFFELKKVNYFLYHVVNTIYALVGICLIYSVAIGMKTKLHIFNMKNKWQSSFMQNPKLYLFILFGMLSQFITLILACSEIIPGYQSINAEFIKDIKFSLDEFLFLLSMFFTILFGVFFSCFVYGLNCTNISTYNSNEEKSFNTYMKCKLIFLAYLFFFSCSYIFVKLLNMGYMLKNTPLLYKHNFTILLWVFPYLISSFNAAFYYCMTAHVRNSDFIISINNFENGNFKKNEKNSL